MSKITETETRKKTITKNIVELIKHHDINVFIKNKDDEYIEVDVAQLRCDEIGDLIVDFMG